MTETNMMVITILICLISLILFVLMIFALAYITHPGKGLPNGWKNAYGPPDSYQSKIAEAFAKRDELIAHSEMREELYKIIEEEKNK